MLTYMEERGSNEFVRLLTQVSCVFNNLVREKEFERDGQKS